MNHLLFRTTCLCVVLAGACTFHEGGLPAPAARPLADAAAPAGNLPIVKPGPLDPPPARDPAPPSADAADAATATAPADAGPPPPAPPASADAAPAAAPVPGTSGVCPRGAPGLRLCMQFEGTPLDEAAGHAVDALQLGYRLGPAGMAGQIGDPSDVHLADRFDLDLSAFTLEVWLQLASLPPTGHWAVVEREDLYGLHVRPGGELDCYAPGGRVAGPMTIRPGAWTSVACTVEPQRIVLWVDGQPRVSAPRIPAPALPLMPPLSIGGKANGGDNMTGLIDNLRIWQGARTAAEICSAALTCRR